MHISEIGLCGGHSASGRVGRRARATTVPGPVRGRRPGLRAAQLHDRRVRLRRPGRHARRRARPSARADAARGPDRRRPRADLPAAAPPGRAAAAAGRVQAAPLRQRLRGPAQDRRQAGDRRRGVRADGRRDRRDGRPHPARADALRRGDVHPRLRGDGRPRVAGAHGEPLGPVPRAGRPSRRATTPTGSATSTCAARRRRDGVPETPGRAVPRARRRRSSGLAEDVRA